MEIKNFFFELSDFYNTSKTQLAEANINEQILIRLNEQTNNWLGRTCVQIENLRQAILSGKLMTFLPHMQELSCATIGVLITEEPVLDSIILKTTKEKKSLMILCNFDLNSKWNLQYLN